MTPVEIVSHYGQRITLDQCPECGGLWFDKFELYRAKLDQADKLENIDSARLTNPTLMKNYRLLCPRDRAELIRFDDKYFPSGIIVAKCPVCEGFWLNRGEFTKYQKARRASKQPREVIITESNAQLEEKMQRILADYQSNKGSDTLARLGNFLSTPVDTVTMKPVASGDTASAAERTISTAMSVLMLALRLFLRV
ncbi:MAG: zf-TFIIB domain-containing protein [Dehalococcoidales bacterium]|nr:zf-TFIIB domain-containing protein [Dehalococcoidales bacterium]